MEIYKIMFISEELSSRERGAKLVKNSYYLGIGPMCIVLSHMGISNSIIADNFASYIHNSCWIALNLSLFLLL